MRHLGTVEVAAHGERLFSAKRKEMFRVGIEVLNVRFLRVVVQKGVVEVQPDKPAALLNRAELVVREVARVAADRFCVRMRGDDRPFGALRDVPKEPFARVREIHNDAGQRA